MVRARLTAMVLTGATAGPLALTACGHGQEGAAVEVTVPTPTAGVVARFDGAVRDGLVDTRLMPSGGTKRPAETTEVVFGAGATPAPWHAAGFPAAGVGGAQHLVRYDITGPEGAQVFVALLDVDRPAGADRCDAPWLHPDFAERPCVTEEVGGDVDLVTVTFSNIRETYLVGPHATIGVTAMRADADGRLVAPVPVSGDEQRELLLAVTRSLSASAA